MFALPAELLIPALNWRTASVLGLSIPPPLNIAIRPNKFEVGGNVTVVGATQDVLAATAAWCCQMGCTGAASPSLAAAVPAEVALL